MGNCLNNSKQSVIVKEKYTEEEIKQITTFNKHFTKQMYGYICSVYDGDTCTAIINVDNQEVKISIRMSGYDCPEMKPSKSKLDRDYEIKFAKLAKAKLSELVLNKKVKIMAHGLDKYGRLLGTLFNTNNVNNYMLENGYGYKYEGATKANIEYHDNFYILNGTKYVIKNIPFNKITVTV